MTTRPHQATTSAAGRLDGYRASAAQIPADGSALRSTRLDTGLASKCGRREFGNRHIFAVNRG